jgi:sodium/bile acid cotransporter 7
MLKFWRRYWFLLSLTAILAIGMGWSAQLTPLAGGLPREWIIASVLLAMALPLRFDALAVALRYPRPVLLAVAVNWLLIPSLAWLASHWLMPDLALGLIIAAAVPCTLASAAVWTRLAGGNDAVSLLVTIITNLSCFFVTPALIQFFAGRADVTISFSEMAGKLLVLIVMPLVLAQLLRRITPVSHWANKRRPLLTGYAQCGILAIVFVGAVHCGSNIAELPKFEAQLALLLLIVVAIHLIAWFSGFWLAGRANCRRLCRQSKDPDGRSDDRPAVRRLDHVADASLSCRTTADRYIVSVAPATSGQVKTRSVRQALSGL